MAAPPVATSTNSWLRAQRKSDLSEIAENIGLKNYESFKKSELEAALDEYLAEHSNRFASRPDLTGYYNSRSKALGSPVKRESLKDEAERGLKVAKRRATKLAEEIAADVRVLTSRDARDDSSEDSRGSSTALVQTPGRSLSQVAARIPLPATPADVANAVDRSTMVVRQRVTSMYEESGITEASHATREALSTVTSILFLVQAFELFFIRAEVLANRYAFTIPAVSALGTSDIPVYLPDMFLLLTSSFWSPALTWVLTSVAIPSLFGYFFNLSVSHAPVHRTRSKSSTPEYVVDPLTFSIAKAIISYVVYGQGVTFGGLLSDVSIERLNRAVYGGYQGMLTGSAVTALVSFYDAILRK